MELTLLDKLLCPVCASGDWTMESAEVEVVHYASGSRDEVKAGRIVCRSGHTYPISQFVLSLESCFPDQLKREASFWNNYYGWHLTHGLKGGGLHDLREGYRPFKTSGVDEPFPFADVIDRYDIHYKVADHPLLQAGHTLLDIGVGLGWTTIHLARAGYEVTAFDPGLFLVHSAKEWAIKQGLFIEYLCAALGYVQFRPASLDNVTAFHSLHHVPDLHAGLTDIKRWLRPGGALATDEHISNSKLAAGIQREIYYWAEKEIFPRYRTLSDADLAALPAEAHSPLEDSGIDQLRSLLHSMFTVRYERQRHTFLDHYPVLYYLSKDKEPTAYLHALEIANQIQEMIRLNDPDGGDYMTLVATNDRAEMDASTNTRSESWGEGVDNVADIATGTEVDQPFSKLEESQALKQQIALLYDMLSEQAAWSHSLQSNLLTKDTELDRLQVELRKMQNGKVMRLLDALHKLTRRRNNAQP